MTIWISRELPLFNFEHLDILCHRIGHPCENFWRLEFLVKFRCSISSVPLWYALESDIRVKSYYHSNFLRDLVVLFQASRYIIRLNLTYMWKLMTIWISWEFPVFNFERLDMLCSWIGHPSEKLLPFEFLERFSCSISSVSLCSALESDIRAKSYRHLNFSRVSGIHFRASRCDAPESDFRCEKLWLFEFIESFRCSIWSVSICDAPESDLRVITYDHLNFSRASVVRFLASRYAMLLNRTSLW